MEHNIFLDKSHVPTEANLKEALGGQYELWMEFSDQIKSGLIDFKLNH
jgi:hypothetical protein